MARLPSLFRPLVLVLVVLCAVVALSVAGSSAEAGTIPQAQATVSIIAPTVASPAEEAAEADSLTCSDSYALKDVYTYNRTQACIPFVYAIVWKVKGVEVGKTTIYWLSAYQLNYKGRDFTVPVKIVKVTVTGFYRPLSEEFSSSCASPCKATTHWPQGSVLATGLDGSVSVHDSIGTGDKHTTKLSYVAIVTPAGYGPIPFRWSSPVSFRCDDMLAFQGAGCVFASYIPTLTLSRGAFGAAADMISWAQKHLDGAWGLEGRGDPLRRLANSEKSDQNRAVICGRAWKSMGSKIGGDFGDTDSCDEFPFAATYESGGSSVSSGAECAQVVAVETGKAGQTEPERWNTVEPLGSHSADAACVRGHTPLTENTDVGNAYRVFIGPQRLLDEDQFWVSVTA
jgi:hypothetical protein